MSAPEPITVLAVLHAMPDAKDDAWLTREQAIERATLALLFRRGQPPVDEYGNAVAARRAYYDAETAVDALLAALRAEAGQSDG